jgi:hypothetical protein
MLNKWTMQGHRAHRHRLAFLHFMFQGNSLAVALEQWLTLRNSKHTDYDVGIFPNQDPECHAGADTHTHTHTHTYTLTLTLTHTHSHTHSHTHRTHTHTLTLTLIHTQSPDPRVLNYVFLVQQRTAEGSGNWSSLHSNEHFLRNHQWPRKKLQTFFGTRRLSPPLVPILGQINPVHTTPSYLSKINFNMPASPFLGFPSGPFPSGFSSISYVFSSSPSFVLHALSILSAFTLSF